MLAKSAPAFLMSNKYHSFTPEELDEMQSIFDARCLLDQELASSEQRRLELARDVVTTYSPRLSEIAIAMLAMSLII